MRRADLEPTSKRVFSLLFPPLHDASDAETTGWGCTGFLGASGCRERFRRSDSLSRARTRQPAQNCGVGPSTSQTLRASASVGAFFAPSAGLIPNPRTPVFGVACYYRGR